MKIKKIASLMMAIICSSSMLFGCSKEVQTSSTNIYQNMFTENKIMDIKINIDEKEWEDILDNPKVEEYHKANIEINGTTLENIGIRTKGFSSLQSVALSDESDRYSFRIKLDKYVDNQTLDGLNEFVLNNNFNDPSYMREYLSYEALKYLGADIPEKAYTNVYVNGELIGFYLALEAIDDSFIERLSDTSSKDVKLYKAESDNANLADENSLKGFDLKYGKDDSQEGLKKLVESLNIIEDNNKGNIEQILDVDSVLKAVAVNTVLGNYDSYNGSKAHNYFLLEEDGVFKYIAWDFNMSFGGFFEDNGASVSVNINEPVYNVDLSKRPLIEKLLSIDEYKEKYNEYLQSLIIYYDNFEEQVTELSNFIKEHVKNDPTAFYTYEQFQTNITKSDADLSSIEAKGFKNKVDRQQPNGEIPDMSNMQLPEQIGKKPDMENRPQLPQNNGENNKGGKGKGMNLNNSTVSIVDYLQQRIENIKSQLNNTK